MELAILSKVTPPTKNLHNDYFRKSIQNFEKYEPKHWPTFTPANCCTGKTGRAKRTTKINNVMHLKAVFLYLMQAIHLEQSCLSKIFTFCCCETYRAVHYEKKALFCLFGILVINWKQTSEPSIVTRALQLKIGLFSKTFIFHRTLLFRHRR